MATGPMPISSTMAAAAPMVTTATPMETKAHMSPPAMAWHDTARTNTYVATGATLEFFVRKDGS